VWKALDKIDTLFVAQIAPSDRVAIGERYGLKGGENATGKSSPRFRKLGFDTPSTTLLSAPTSPSRRGRRIPLTRREERFAPQFTSCCPSWVKVAEHFSPNSCRNLSRQHVSTNHEGPGNREDERRKARPRKNLNVVSRSCVHGEKI
jgi:NADH-quinone oxidoreductase subunit G